MLSKTPHSQSSVLDWGELIEKKIWRRLLVAGGELIGLATQTAFVQKEYPLSPFPRQTKRTDTCIVLNEPDKK